MTPSSERISKKLAARSFVQDIRLSMHTHLENETLTKTNRSGLFLAAATAAEKGDLSRVRQLSALGVPFDRAVKLDDGRMRSPIQLARAGGHMEIVSFMIESRK